MYKRQLYTHTHYTINVDILQISDLIVEIEIVYVLILLCSTVGFMMGSFLSPSSRMAKKEISYWRGLTGDFKKQLKAEKREKIDSTEDLLDGDLSLGKVLKLVQENPDLVNQVMGQIGKLQSNGQPSINDRSGFHQGLK